MKRAVSLAAAAALAGALIGGSADARIEGPWRETIIAGAEGACQARAAQSSVISADMAHAYCSCVTEYVVDNTTVGELRQSYAGVAPGTQPPVMMRLLKSGLQYCLLNVKQYYHGAEPAAAVGRAARQAGDNAPRQPGSVYLVPRDEAGAAPAPSRNEECSQYVLKVVTDRSQSVCRAK